MTGASRPAGISATILVLVCLVRVDGAAAQDAITIEEEIAGYEEAIRDFGCTDAMRENIDALEEKIETGQDRELRAVTQVYNERTEKITKQIE